MMKQFLTQITPLSRTAKLLGLTLLTATVLTTTPALALEYTEADAAAGSFGKPTSVEPVTVVGGSNIYETDVSKNAAYIPPAFGSPMADMPGSGERLTPNLLTSVHSIQRCFTSSKFRSTTNRSIFQQFFRILNQLVPEC